MAEKKSKLVYNYHVDMCDMNDKQEVLAKQLLLK